MNRSRPERNREREKHRRDALKEAIESLQDKLLQHDETFRQEAHRRTLTTASRVAHTAKSVTNSDASWSFTKVEIINQAIHTIDEVMAQNQEMKILLLEIAKHPAQSASLLEASVNLPPRPRAAFHQGVGPLVTVPPVAVPPEEPMRKKCKLEDATMHIIRHAAASTVTEPTPAKPNNHGSFIHYASDVRESKQQPPASTSDNLHAQSVANHGPEAGLRTLLVGASFRNQQRLIPSYSSTLLAHKGHVQAQRRMDAVTALAAIQDHVQPPPAADSSVMVRNLLPLSTSTPSALPSLRSSLMQFPASDPNLILKRRLAAEYEHYRGAALPTTKTDPANLQFEKAFCSGQESTQTRPSKSPI